MKQKQLFFCQIPATNAVNLPATYYNNNYHISAIFKYQYIKQPPKPHTTPRMPSFHDDARSI